MTARRAGVWAVALLAAAADPPSPPELPDLSHAEPQVRAVLTAAHKRLVGDLNSGRRWGRYASLLGVHEYVAESVAAYEMAERLDPTNFRWPYLAAVRLAEENPPASLAALRQALALRDVYAPAHLRHGSMMERQGDAEEALASYRRAVELDDDNAYAHAALGRRLLDDGHRAEAGRHLERAYELDPKCRPALMGLAAYCRVTGEPARAQRLARQAAGAPKAQPPDPVLSGVERLQVGTGAIMSRVTELIQAGRRQEARRLLNRLVTANPDSARGRTALGNLLIEDGAIEQAIAQYRAAIELPGHHVTARLGLASALTRSGRYDEARGEYERLLADHPTSAPAYSGLAVCLAITGEIELAAQRFGEALALAPESRRARAGYGRALYFMGDHRSAVDALMPQAFNPAADLDEIGIEAAVHAGLALVQLERYEEACSLLGRALAVKPKQADVRQALADALIVAGRHQEAVEVLQEGLDLNPGAGRMAVTLAGLLATSPHDDVRDGREAVRLAERWAASTGHRNPDVLVALACAYAEVGRFEDAVDMARRAHELAIKNKREDLIGDIEARLQLFEQNTPYRGP